MHVDRALAGHLVAVGVAPQRRHQLGALDRAALAQHEVLQQLELLEGERRRLAVDVHAPTRDVDRDAAGHVVVVGGVGLGAGDGARLVQREADDVDVAPAGVGGGERDGGVALGLRGELGERLAERRDDRRERDAVGGSLQLVEADVEGEATRGGAGGHAGGRRRGGLGRRSGRHEAGRRGGVDESVQVAGRGCRSGGEQSGVRHEMVLWGGTRAVRQENGFGRVLQSRRCSRGGGPVCEASVIRIVCGTRR